VEVDGEPYVLSPGQDGMPPFTISFAINAVSFCPVPTAFTGHSVVELDFSAAVPWVLAEPEPD
jgi:hypothetical protein